MMTTGCGVTDGSNGVRAEDEALPLVRQGIKAARGRESGRVSASQVL